MSCTRDNRVAELDVFILLTIASYGLGAGLWQASNVLEAPVHPPTGASLLRVRLDPARARWPERDDVLKFSPPTSHGFRTCDAENDV